MKHIIFSDTHSPTCAQNIYDYFDEVLKKHQDVDCIVMNGDLLGTFSMTGSTLHKNKGMTKEQLIEYFKLGAPIFYEEISDLSLDNLDEELIIRYVAERYSWCVKFLKKCSEKKKTIFNLGNHESPLHWLVLTELEFFIGDHPAIKKVSQTDLHEVFELFEKRLHELEKSNDFHYIRNEPLLLGSTLILGIPGESHNAIGTDQGALTQEEKTKQLIKKCSSLIKNASEIIIYNHTQGNYNSENGLYEPLSPALKDFMQNLPGHITMKIFVQSHNHWSYTHFHYHSGFYFILNNAGLNGSIFNLIDFNFMTIKCYDIDSKEKRIVPVKLLKEFKPIQNPKEHISRYYDDVELILNRKK